MFKQISRELKEHVPFTVIGAISGIALVFFFHKLPFSIAHNVFYVLHPIHVLLSALATASMYKLHKCPTTRKSCSLGLLLLIGYLGSIGIATLSDSVIPYLAESLLDMPRRQIHLGFIEKWWLINPLAIIGVVIAYFKPSTKFPHAGHVLWSTWASVFHIIMAMNGGLNGLSYIIMLFFLFIAVWIPCCVSDIVFPLLFVNDAQTYETK